MAGRHVRSIIDSENLDYFPYSAQDPSHWNQNSNKFFCFLLYQKSAEFLSLTLNSTPSSCQRSNNIKFQFPSYKEGDIFIHVCPFITSRMHKIRAWHHHHVELLLSLTCSTPIPASSLSLST